MTENNVVYLVEPISDLQKNEKTFTEKFVRQIYEGIVFRSHEVIENALRNEVVSVSDIKAVFENFGIDVTEEVKF